MGWKINFWARLRDGDHSRKMLGHQLSPVGPGTGRGGGGTYPNLFDAHPPFQIDGNFGATMGISEMLIQDHTGWIELLPALPSAWPNGSFTGLRARGGFEIDLKWENSRPVEIKVKSTVGGRCRLKWQGRTVNLQTNRGEEIVVDPMA
jgi:alpha-L-fucosidase 2